MISMQHLPIASQPAVNDCPSHASGNTSSLVSPSLAQSAKRKCMTLKEYLTHMV
jgi:hypothetical protein